MSQTIDPFDELAAMFLSSPAPTPPSSKQSPPAAASISPKPPGHAHSAARSAPLDADVLIVGHLPVRAGLWLTPYADALARDHGCIGMIRLDASEPSVQILRGSDELASWEQPPTLEEAIAELADIVDGWIVRPAIDSQCVDLVAAGSPQITILSSADEAAVVGAYQLIKNIAQAAQDTDSPVPHVRLAVMGADQAAAQAVVERLNRTTVSFLGVEVRLAGSLPRMDASIRSTRYMTFAHQPMPALADVLTWIDSAKQRSRLKSLVQQSQDVSDVIGRVGAAAESPRKPEVRRPPLRIQEPVSPHERFVNDQPQRETAAATSLSAAPMRMRPKPAMDVEAKDTGAPREPDDHGRPVPLASHVDGLSVLAVRMPGHEQVELAVDRAGRLHVLGLENSLRELSVVQSWTLAHRELIAMACPQHTIDQAATIAVHVFTDRPAALADLHGTNLWLHVRAPVVVSGQIGWYCAQLNAPK